MRVIAVVATKGGVGKTTLATNLAVGLPGATLIDADPQGSASIWNADRAGAGLVGLYDGSVPLAEIVRQVEGWIILDTPPAGGPRLLEAIKVADIALVPVRPSNFDLKALGPTMAVIDRVGAKSGFVLSQVASGRTATAARAYLGEHYPSVPVLGSLGQRVSYQYAAIGGQSVLEYEPHGKAAGEVRELLKWLNH